jgi:hypothetical protein
MAGKYLGRTVLPFPPIDATYTFDAEGPDGTVLSADQLYTAAAVNLHDGGFAR